MRSSWLLLKVYRRQLGICLLLEFVTVFLAASRNIRPHRPDSVWFPLAVTFLCAFLSSLFFQSIIRFSRLPFPVSTRQRAWLPMLVFGLIWAMGCLAIVLAVFCLGAGAPSLIRSIVYLTIRLPLHALGFLLISRIIQARPHFIGFASFIVLAAIGDSSWYRTCASTYHLWWPVVLGAIAFYIYEAPIQLARLNRLSVGQRNHPLAFRVDHLNIAYIRDFATWLADTLEGAVLLCLAVNVLLTFLPSWIPDSLPDLLSLPALTALVPLGLAFCLLVIFRSQYQYSFASGFGPVSAFWMTLMQITILLIPLAQTLGVKKGVVAQCDQCRRAKFLWALRCPHCGHAGPGTIINRRLARVVQGRSPLPHRRMRFLARAFIPFQIFLIFWLIWGREGQAFCHAYSVDQL